MTQVHQQLQSLANPQKALIMQRFFKTGKGEYGEGDVFLGLTVPQIRLLAKRFKGLPMKEVKQLLHSKIHEERLLALIVLVNQFKKADEKVQKEIFDFYLGSTAFINNWDLVDTSAEHIVGGYLLKRSKAILTKLAKSKLLWDRRIAIMATFHFIRRGEYAETFRIAKLLLKDQHDLIHKAVGCMLREVGGKISEEIEEEFLRRYYHKMPRTMLRYAIEKFKEKRRKDYLKGLV